MPKKKIAVKNHILIPKHIKLSEKDKKKLLEDYNVSLLGLPKIKQDDPIIAKLNVKQGDIIKIIRSSPTAGEIVFYRVVIVG